MFLGFRSFGRKTYGRHNDWSTNALVDYCFKPIQFDRQMFWINNLLNVWSTNALADKFIWPTEYDRQMFLPTKLGR